MQSKKRIYSRFSSELSARYRILKSATVFREIRVCDVGIDGLSFISPDLLDIGQHLELRLEFGPAEAVSCIFEIRWIKRAEPAEFKIGGKIVEIKFVDELKLIKFYCQSIILSAGMEKSILIVDDEKDLVALLQIELEQEHYRVSAAYDGEEGYSKYLLEHPHLILLDVGIPKLNGYEVCRKIRREQQDNTTPILMLSAKSDDTDRIVGRVVGAEKYITKPFDTCELLHEIEGLLYQRHHP